MLDDYVELGEAEELEKRARQKKPNRFPLIAFGSLRPQPKDNYIIKKLIPRRALVLIWGPPKCLKSFLTFDMTMSIARGLEYRGRKTIRGVVVYCAFEGASGFGNRAEAYRKRWEVDDKAEVPFFLMGAHTDLIRDCRALLASIRTQLNGSTPDVVVLDTLNRSLHGSESKDQDMAAYIAAADEIRETFDCCVIIVHHCGIDDTRPRGHSSLGCAVDVQLAVVREEHTAQMTVEWMKEGAEGDKIFSTIEVVDVGLDDDGETITSCVVVPAQSEVLDARKSAKLPYAARVALRALAEALCENGEAPPAVMQIPAGVKVVREANWRRFAYARGTSGSPGERAKQQAFKRAYEKLLGIGRIGTWDEFVWLIG